MTDRQTDTWILAVLVEEQLRVHQDVHSNGYRLPPAVQSVLLQWDPFLRAVLVMILLDKQRDPDPRCCPSVAGVGLPLGPRSLVGFSLPLLVPAAV